MVKISTELKRPTSAQLPALKRPSTIYMCAVSFYMLALNALCELIVLADIYREMVLISCSYPLLSHRSDITALMWVIDP